MGTKVTSSSGSVLEEPGNQERRSENYSLQAKIFKEKSLNIIESHLIQPLNFLMKDRLSQIPYDTSDPANRFAPNREETMTLDNESRSKLDKETVKPYDYTRQNSLYEIFKAPSLEYLYQLERAKEVRKTIRLIAIDQASGEVLWQMTSVYISSGLVLHQMTSDHNRSELGIHRPQQ
ncbi:hypothetical protein Tco_1556150 [Tanacetum coccineum]